MNNLYMYRKYKGYTQSEMAKKLSVSRQTYINYEKGRTEPTYDVLVKISNVLNKSTDELLDNKSHIVRKLESILTDIRMVLDYYKL